MFNGPEIWEFLMWVVPLLVSVIQAVRQPIVEDIIHRSVDALCGFVSGELRRFWQYIRQKKTQVVDLQKIVEELKTEIIGVKAEIEVLREKNGAMEKQVVDLLKIEELKTQIKGLEAENKVLREKNGAMEKQLVQSPVPRWGQYQGSFGGQILSLTFEGRLGIIKSNIGEEGGIPVGPWGGNRGGYWAYKVDVAPILQITLGCGQVIDSILITSKSRDGSVIGCSNRFGGPGGHTVTFCIDSSVEQLSAISLTYGDWGGMTLITSLTFYSNRDKYGPYGWQIGSTVSIPIDEGTILAGFHGRCGCYLDSFGVLVAPKGLNNSHKVRLEEI